MSNEQFIKAIKENYVEILKGIIGDKQKEIKRQQIIIVILILLIFAVAIFHFYNYKDFIKTHYAAVEKEVVANE